MESLSFRETEVRKLIDRINLLIRGRNNANGRVTLTANATSTEVTSANVGAGDVVLLMPETAAAASELAAGGMYVVAAAGTFTITHANDASTTRTFGWVAFGP